MVLRLFTSLLMSFSLVFSLTATADIDADLQNICTIVKNNDKGELRKKVKNIKKNYKMNLGVYYGGVSCGGTSMIRYALTNSANEVGTFLVKKMKKKDLKSAEADGQTLQQWAESNGHGASPIIASLISRIG